MLYIIDIHWERRVPEEGRPDKGHSTFAAYGRTLNAAITKTKSRFRLHYGMHLAITSANEKQDPAGIFTSSKS